jgi:hypothetical protein
MKPHNFVKYHPQIDQITGSQQGTLILSALEYWFIKKPDGFYKFMEPCAHRLYKKGDSWLEEVGLVRKRFARAFEEFGIKYPSRSAFENAEDKFEGKLYASYYDRYSNRTFFVRNHDLANETLKPYFKAKKVDDQKGEGSSNKSADSLPHKPLSNGHNGRSYKDTKSTSENLSKDKSHAEEIIKKMIEIWTALVEEGRDQIELTSKRIAYLKQAFRDKFDSCLEKWNKYCQEIASRRFLMGEKTPWRASLDWALKFANIQKVFDGHYGTADRTPKTILPSYSNLEDQIYSSNEVQEIKDFRVLCLKTVGNAKYISYFNNMMIEFPSELQGEGGIILMAPHKFAADDLERNCYSYLRLILQNIEEKTSHITILSPGEERGRLVERERGGGVPQKLLTSSTVESPMMAELPAVEVVSEEKTQLEISLETKALRAQLKKNIPPKLFPGWLAEIKVQGITGEGVLILTFDDHFKTTWCKRRFSQQILQSARELWGGDYVLEIQEELVDSLDNSDENACGLDKTSMFYKAIQSLRDMNVATNGDLVYG